MDYRGILYDAASQGNVLHCPTKLRNKLMIQEHEFIVYSLQYLLECSQQKSLEYTAAGETVLGALTTIHKDGKIDQGTFANATKALNSCHGAQYTRLLTRDTRARQSSIRDASIIEKFVEMEFVRTFECSLPSTRAFNRRPFLLKGVSIIL